MNPSLSKSKLPLTSAILYVIIPTQVLKLTVLIITMITITTIVTVILIGTVIASIGCRQTAAYPSLPQATYGARKTCMRVGWLLNFSHGLALGFSRV